MVTKETHSKINCNSTACKTTRNEGVGLHNTFPCCLVCSMNAEKRQILLFCSQLLLCCYQVFKANVTAGRMSLNRPKTNVWHNILLAAGTTHAVIWKRHVQKRCFGLPKIATSSFEGVSKLFTRLCLTLMSSERLTKPSESYRTSTECRKI